MGWMRRLFDCLMEPHVLWADIVNFYMRGLQEWSSSGAVQIVNSTVMMACVNVVRALHIATESKYKTLIIQNLPAWDGAYSLGWHVIMHMFKLSRPLKCSARRD
jgi:hypothetical protein